MVDPVSSIDRASLIIFICASKERLKSINLTMVSTGFTLLPSKTPLCSEALLGPVGKSSPLYSGLIGSNKPSLRLIKGVSLASLNISLPISAAGISGSVGDDANTVPSGLILSLIHISEPTRP